MVCIYVRSVNLRDNCEGREGQAIVGNDERGQERTSLYSIIREM